MANERKIPGTDGATPIGSWAEFERYARVVADDPKTSPELALQLVDLAAKEVGHGQHKNSR